MTSMNNASHWEVHYNHKGQKFYYNPKTNQSEWERPTEPIALTTPSPPHKDDPIWIVRISQRRGAENARKDYSILKEALYTQDNWDKMGVWDKDTKNKMKPDSWIGFIVGDVGSEVVELFYIERDSKNSRPKHWCTEESYTDQKSDIAPNTRETVHFKKQNIIRMTWAEWKLRVGYSVKYIPRGTTTSKNPY